MAECPGHTVDSLQIADVTVAHSGNDVPNDALGIDAQEIDRRNFEDPLECHGSSIIEGQMLAGAMWAL